MTRTQTAFSQQDVSAIEAAISVLGTAWFLVMQGKGCALVAPVVVPPAGRQPCAARGGGTRRPIINRQKQLL